MTSQGPLTSWLLASTPQAFKRATTHPFLASAGQGTLPKSTLSQWLSQDRLYAQSYIRFIGFLLAKIRLPSKPYNSGSSHHTDAQAINVLIDALVNIRTELQFFEATAAEYNLDLTAIASEECGAGLTKTGSISTSAGISTMGSGSCPGFTGSACQSKIYSADAVRSGEFDEDMQAKQQEASDGATRGPDLHRLCNAQGECQMQDWSQVCFPLSQRPSTEDASTGPMTTTTMNECEPGPQPTRGYPASVTPFEPGGTIYFGPTTITRAYIDMFMSSASSGVSVMEGMAVLWATEVCYLRSWKYAATFLKREGPAEQDTDGGALREKFIPNWSSPEFESFVDRIGEVLDSMAEQTKGAEEAEEMRRRCLEWWRQVVWLEERFWPTMD